MARDAPILARSRGRGAGKMACARGMGFGTESVLPERTHTIRLEDLCDRPAELMDRLFAFLDLEMCDELRGRMLQYVYARPNEKYDGIRVAAS